jgi:O-antigen/teichoic acid export membrane protein
VKMSTATSMVTSGKVIRRNTVLNAASLMIPMAVAVFAIPRLIAAIGTARFGILSLCWVVIGYSGLFDLGLGRALTKLVAEKLGTEDEKDVPSLIWTSVVLMAAFGTVGGILVALSGPFVLSRWIHIPSELTAETFHSIYIIAASLPIVVVTAGLRGVMEAAQRFDMAGSLRTVLGIFNFVSPVLILPFSIKLSTIILVLVIGRIAILVAHLILCVRIVPSMKWGIHVSSRSVGPLIRFGMSSTVSSITAPLLMTLDRFMVGAQVSVSAVSYYASPDEITSRLGLFPNALVGVLFPAFSASSAQDRTRAVALFKRSARVMMALIFPAALATVAFAHVGLQLWLGPEFAKRSCVVLQLLAISMFVNSFGLLAFTFVQGAGRPGLCAKLNLGELPIYIPVIWYLTRTFGIEGAATAALVRVVFDTAILLVFSLRVLPPLRKTIVEVFLMISIGLVALMAGIIPLFAAALPYLFLAGSVSCAVFAWRCILRHNEREFLLNYCRRFGITEGA